MNIKLSVIIFLAIALSNVWLSLYRQQKVAKSDRLLEPADSLKLKSIVWI